MPLVSEPERAVLETISQIPSKQSLEEAQNIMESLYGLRGPLIQELLEACFNIKTICLFLNLAKKTSCHA